MAVIQLSGVVRDDVPPAGIDAPAPVAQRISWPQYEDGAFRVSVTKADGGAYDLTGCVLVFTVRSRSSNAGTALISRAATVIDTAAGLADIELVAADTAQTPQRKVYRYDVVLTLASGERVQIIPESEFYVAPALSKPGDAVTVPVSATPLGLGPAWLPLMEADAAELLQTDGTTAEQVALEVAFNFDLLPATLANMLADVSAIASVTGGTGTIRLRVGGTPDVADGTTIATVAVTGGTEAVVGGSGTAAKLTGRRTVKLTLQNSVNGQRTRARGVAAFIRGAA